MKNKVLIIIKIYKCYSVEVKIKIEMLAIFKTEALIT